MPVNENVFEEFLNRLKSASDLSMDPVLAKTNPERVAEAREAAAAIARIGLKQHYFSEPSEIQIAVQAILRDKTDGKTVACVHVEGCCFEQLCAVNRFIDLQVVEGNLTNLLADRSRYDVSYDEAVGCPKAVRKSSSETEAELRAAHYTPADPNG